ncbi:hypothetical protein D3C77_603000 [compost metagenome]
MNDGIVIMIDDQILSVKSDHDMLDFPPTLTNDKQLDLNGVYVATYSYQGNDRQAIQSIKLRRK